MTVRLKEYKELSEDNPIEAAALPGKVYIHLSQHLGKPATPEVKAGDEVSTGERIASSEAAVSACVHASVSGKVINILQYPHPVLGSSSVIAIESDGKDTHFSCETRSREQIDKLNASDIRRIVQDAGIVGLGGATFPTHIKLSPPHKVDTLIINGAECEPYLNSDYRLMLENTQELLTGIGLVARCLGVRKVIVAIEDNKPEAISKFSGPGFRFPVKVLESAYPQGGEKQLIKNILGEEVPSGKLPFDIGVVVHNVATVYAIYEAVYKCKPLYERVVTVTGSCLENPKNLRARIGTPIGDLIEQCSPLKKEPHKIIMGGPMMGIAQAGIQAPVIKATSGIILLDEKEAACAEEEACIRCGACVRECPSGLLPCTIDAASRKENWQLALDYGAMDCIECGLCSYVCPASRFLVQSIKLAKLKRKL